MTFGILNDRMIRKLWTTGGISSPIRLDSDQVQPASLDLRLGSVAYRVRASFLPGKKSTVTKKLDQFAFHEIDLSSGAVLETGCVYIVPLLESLSLPIDLGASTNPKSSTGRLDVFTRVIADYSGQFDVIPDGYRGPLYLEISPRTFPIVVRTKSRLSQIRFRRGNAVLSKDELVQLHKHQTLVATRTPDISARGIAMSIDLTGDKKTGLVGYRGKRHTGVVDVDKRASLDRRDFWEPLYKRGTNIVLDPDQFYILVSREAVCVPPPTAAEMVPFDPLVGEFRVHYAGFFDPGFGHKAAGGGGARAVLEVRSHEVPFILEHGQIIGRLVYEHMLQPPKILYGKTPKSNYQGQGLKLSKHFR